MCAQIYVYVDKMNKTHNAHSACDTNTKCLSNDRRKRSIRTLASYVEHVNIENIKNADRIEEKLNKIDTDKSTHLIHECDVNTMLLTKPTYRHLDIEDVVMR